MDYHDSIRFPFGKHRGKPLPDIPNGYLAWVLRECDLDPWLRAAVQCELQRRLDVAYGPSPGPGPGFHPPVQLGEIIRRWHREMALEFHPDRGGSNEAMKAINRAVERLRELVEAA